MSRREFLTALGGMIVATAFVGVVPFGEELFNDTTATQKRLLLDKLHSQVVPFLDNTVIMEINDTATRKTARLGVEELLETYSEIGDYAVCCDNNNNTPKIIAANEFSLDMYIKPTFMDNFIKVNYYVKPSSMSFADINSEDIS